MPGTPINGSFPLFLRAFDEFTDATSESFPLLIEGITPISLSSGIPLYIQGLDFSSGNIPLHIYGTEQINDNIILFTHGLSYNSGNIPLYINGTYNIDSGVPLFVHGLDYNSGNVPLFTKGHLSVSGNFPLFVHGLDSVTDNIYLYTSGRVWVNSGEGMPLFIRSVLDQETLDLYGIAASSHLNLYIECQTRSVIPLFVGGKIENESGVPLFIRAFDNILDVNSGNIPLYLNSAIIESGSITLAIPETYGISTHYVRLFTRGQ